MDQLRKVYHQAETAIPGEDDLILIDPATLFTKMEQVGEGSFGIVYKGMNKKTGEIVAIKIVDLEASEDDIEDIQKEINILSSLDSPYTTKYFDSFLKESQLWIILEYCGGGSALELIEPGCFDELYCSIILGQVLKGIEYLHDQGKLHRDIKVCVPFFSHQVCQCPTEIRWLSQAC
jgi:serine/threonine-protein kinase 24/25/MST4